MHKFISSKTLFKSVETAKRSYQIISLSLKNRLICSQLFKKKFRHNSHNTLPNEHIHHICKNTSTVKEHDILKPRVQACLNNSLTHPQFQLSKHTRTIEPLHASPPPKTARITPQVVRILTHRITRPYISKQPTHSRRPYLTKNHNKRHLASAPLHLKFSPSPTPSDACTSPGPRVQTKINLL